MSLRPFLTKQYGQVEGKKRTPRKPSQARPRGQGQPSPPHPGARRWKAGPGPRPGLVAHGPRLPGAGLAPRGRKGGGTVRPLPSSEAAPWAPRARHGGRGPPATRGRRSRPPLGRGHHFVSAAPRAAAAPVRSSRGTGRPRALPRSSAASSSPSRARALGTEGSGRPFPRRSHFLCPHLTGALGSLRKTTATEGRAMALAQRTERKRCL